MNHRIPRRRYRGNSDVHVLTAASTPLPAAVPVLQRRPEGQLEYPWRLRMRDGWNGWRDRRLVAASLRAGKPQPGQQPQQDGSTPARSGFMTDCLARLAADCLTQQEFERRTTRTALAVLDNTIVAALRTHRTLVIGLGDIERRLAEANTAEVGDAPVTSAERYDTPEQRRLRRLRDQRAKVVGLTEERRRALAGIADAQQTIDTALADRRAHWDQLLIRSELLCAHYNRRARTYTRAAVRRGGVLISTREQIIGTPYWATPQALPLAPDQPSGPVESGGVDDDAA